MEYRPFLPFVAAKGLLQIFLKRFSMIFLITPLINLPFGCPVTGQYFSQKSIS
jgi:hypothetical protein